MKDLDWSDVEADAERMRWEMESDAYEKWALENAEQIAGAEYLQWCSMMGHTPQADPNSDAAYLEWIDEMVAQAEWEAENYPR